MYVILRGWVTLRLYFRLKGYVSRQYLWTLRWWNGYTTTVLPKVFAQKNFVADCIHLKLNFIKKINQKSLFETPFGDLAAELLILQYWYCCQYYQRYFLSIDTNTADTFHLQ